MENTSLKQQRKAIKDALANSIQSLQDIGNEIRKITIENQHGTEFFDREINEFLAYYNDMLHFPQNPFPTIEDDKTAYDQSCYLNVIRALDKYHFKLFLEIGTLHSLLSSSQSVSTEEPDQTVEKIKDLLYSLNFLEQETEQLHSRMQSFNCGRVDTRPQIPKSHFHTQKND